MRTLSCRTLGAAGALLLLCAFGFPPSGLAAGDDRPRVRIGRTATAPTIDGRMEPGEWDDGALIQEMTQVLPVTGGQPSQRTDVRILTDGKSLYIAFRCYDDEPSKIVANRKLRDNFPFFDDRVNFAIDTFHDHRNGYFFETNPHAMRHDVLLEAENFEISWDTIWFVKTSIDSEGWTAEFAIPYSSISFDPTSDTWGFNFGRGIRRNDEENRWTDPAPQRFVSDLGNAGILEGMSNLDQGIGLQVVPSSTVRRIDGKREISVVRSGVPGTQLVDEHFTRYQPSLDVFYNVLPSVTAALTVNTDFGDVEADARQVNLTAFPLFFNERRDFFLEDALIFDFGDISQNGRPFFTRNIGLTPAGIEAGGKLTGRLGRVKFGVLDTYIDGPEGTDAENLFVARVATSVLGESTLGAIVTNGSPTGDSDDTTVGADFLFRDNSFLGSTNSARASFWTAMSINEGADEVDGDEIGYGIKLEYPNDKHNYLVGFEELRSAYQPSLGFVNRNGIRHWFNQFRYRTRPASGPFRTIDQTFFFQVFTGTDNDLQSARFVLTPFDFVTPLGDGIELAYTHQIESVVPPFVEPGEHRFAEGSLRLFSSRNRPLQADVTVGHGEYFNGTRTRLDLDVEWRPSHYWSIEADYGFDDIRLPNGDLPVHLASLLVRLQITADIVWANLIQWDSVSDTIGLNSRFRWTVRDGREFFIVVNQGVDSKNRFEARQTEALVKAIWTFTF